MAPLVGIDLATPAKGPLNTDEALAAKIARLSEGVTKNCLPKIIFLSASPSHAAPRSGIFSIFSVFVLKGSRISTNSLAYVKLGSGCPFPKSSRGILLINYETSVPNKSPNIFLE